MKILSLLIAIYFPIIGLAQGNDPKILEDMTPVNFKFAISYDFAGVFVTDNEEGMPTGFISDGSGYGFFAEFDFFMTERRAFQAGANLLVSSGSFTEKFMVLNFPFGFKGHLKHSNWYYAGGLDLMVELPGQFSNETQFNGLGFHTTVLAYEIYLGDSDLHLYIEPLARIMPAWSFGDAAFPRRMLNFDLKFGIGF